jgi:hypothetical protein
MHQHFLIANSKTLLKLKYEILKMHTQYRAAILSSEIFSHAQWHHLYPLVIIGINSMITKYYLSRENIHFQDVLENQLPIITDISVNHEIDSDLDEVQSAQFDERATAEKLQILTISNFFHMKDRKSIFCVLVLLFLNSFGIKNHQDVFNHSADTLYESWAIFFFWRFG